MICTTGDDIISDYLIEFYIFPFHYVMFNFLFNNDIPHICLKTFVTNCICTSLNSRAVYYVQNYLF